MENEIVKHINDTNASYRSPNAGNAKNTDLFLDSNHFELFKDSGEQIKVRLNKENLSKAILFIASILPRKYDNSSVHKSIEYSSEFVLDQLALLDDFFVEDGIQVEYKTQTWNARKDVPMKNGEIDNRFYFNGLIEDVNYTNFKGENISTKFTIRNYLAGGYSDLHIKKAEDGVFEVWVTNTQEAYYDDNEAEEKEVKPLQKQKITYGAPGSGKSHGTDRDIKNIYPNKEERKQNVFRTTFHPDSDYSTFVGCYKPTTSKTSILNQDQLIKELNRMIAEEDSYALDKFAYTYWESFEYGINRNAFLSECGKTSQASHLNSGIALGKKFHKKNNSISYSFVPQAFTKAYIQAWRNILEGNNRNVFLVIEEINRGNCAQIFGDLFQLLDRDDEGYSKYAIKPDTDLENYLVESLGDKYDVDEGMKLPPNLYIWATMNTSDQSLFPIDSAFKRRWDWEYVPIDYEDASKYTVKFNDGENTSMNWSAIIQVLNDNIMDLMHNADKQLGNRFISLPKGQTEISSKVFFNKVIFYLWSEIYKDYYEDENTIFRIDDKNISFEDLACEKDDKQLVKMLKSLNDKNKDTIEIIENRIKGIEE